jgi:predicted enzyme related to lactoylglutathione lyase
MKIRLHEIELGTVSLQESSTFFQSLLQLKPRLQQPELSVLDAGVPGIDLNLSTHVAPGVIALSFITDDLEAVEQRLQAAGITYEGPRPSHLGMTAIRFQDTNGYVIFVNQAGTDSPAWLKV